jgi:hypothetical protein
MLALAQMMPACHKFASFTESLGGCRLMREKIAMIFLCAGVIGSFVLAGYWAYWIWQFDWGHSSRGRGLWFMAMIFGSIFVFMAGYFATFLASAAISGDT